MLAARAGRIAVSPTMKVAADAMRLKAQGIDVLDFGAGEPDFPTPAHVGAAAKAAIDANFTKYTTNSGTEDLKRAVARRYQEDYGVEYATSEDHHHGRRQAGAVQRRHGALRPGRRGHHAHAGLADARRADQARRGDAGDRPHLRRRTASGFDADTFLAAITPRTRGIIINSPGNPTGALIDEADARRRSPTKRRAAASGSCSTCATRS